MSQKDHWEKVYQNKSPDEVSWYQLHLQTSLHLISETGIPKNASIIDIGGGASTFVDDLLNAGFTDITVLDISGKALEVSKNRLGKRDKLVQWIKGDVTKLELPKKHYALWHDRAVFHFLTQAPDRKKYGQLLKNSLQPKGYAIIAVFSLEGPPKCSGLDVARYSPSSLEAELGKSFRIISTSIEDHKTPFKTVQKFVYCLFQKI